MGYHIVASARKQKVTSVQNKGISAPLSTDYSPYELDLNDEVYYENEKCHITNLLDENGIGFDKPNFSDRKQ